MQIHNHGWSLFFPFSVPPKRLVDLRSANAELIDEPTENQEDHQNRASEFDRTKALADLHSHVRDHLLDEKPDSFRFMIPHDSSGMSLTRDQIGATPFSVNHTSTECVVFSDGIGFLIGTFALPDETVSLERFTRGNNRLRVPDQPPLLLLGRLFSQYIMPHGAKKLIEERPPLLAHLVVPETTSAEKIGSILATTGNFFWGDVRGAVGDDASGSPMPEGTTSLAPNIFLRASQRGSVLLMIDDGDYAVKKFPVNAGFRWREIYMLALHERFALAQLSSQLRMLTLLRGRPLSQLKFARGLGNLRSSYLNHTSLHRLRDISTDERCQKIHIHLIGSLQIDLAEGAHEKAMEALDEMTGHMHRERMGQVGMIVSAVLFPVSVMSLILGMNVTEFSTDALTSVADPIVWKPLVIGYFAYLFAIVAVLFRR